MATSQHQLEQRITATPSQVRALLSDPLMLPQLHPLIERVTIRATRMEGQTRVIEFDLLERVPVGPFRYPNAYSGTAMVPEDPTRLTLLGVSFPRVVTRSEFEFVAVEEETMVREVFVLTAPGYVHWFVERVGVDAHRRQLEAIARRFAR
jgi:hypothetical protein